MVECHCNHDVTPLRFSQAGFNLRVRGAIQKLLVALSLWLGLLACVTSASALEPIVVQPDVGRLEITTLGDAYRGQGETLQVETAAGTDGVTGRMAVRASTPGISPDWMVFALTNRSDRPVERWLTASRYSVVGSGVIWPDLDAKRIAAITPSIGFVPERIKSDRADIFRITLEPGQTITYVVEMASERFARLHLWQPIEYEVQTRERQLLNGGMLGLIGLLAIFLTAIFAANHKIIFPAAALVSWCALTYLFVDFGLFHRLFNLRPEDNAVHRAAAEASLAASLVIFLYFFLRLSHWHGIVRMLLGVWIVAQLTLIAVAVVDPRLAATFARLSFVGIAAIGGLFTLFLAIRGQERAFALIPAWILFLVWVFAAGLTLTAKLGGEAVVTSLLAGLVVFVMAIGYTVTQFAFRSLEPAFAGTPGDLQSRALALAGSGASVWEWNIRRDEIRVGPELEIALGMMPGELNGKVDEFIKHVHPSDIDKFRVMLTSAQERAGVRIRSEFRMLHVDTSWRWLELEAASIPNADGRTLRCIGLIRDVSDQKRSHERLLHDAVHCSLTGLPNRALFIDRLKTAVARAATDKSIRPAVLFIDMDKFKSANSAFGLVRGDSLLLSVARRLQRQIGPQDTVARIGGDQFAILFIEERDTRNLNALAERIRRSIRAGIPVGDKEIVLTGSIGAAVYGGTGDNGEELLTDAELAMYRAKRAGADLIEIFDPSMRAERDNRIEIESDLRKALDKGQIKVLYQPIVYLPTKELAGFEALVRWEHPKLGTLNPISFVPIAEESDLIAKVGSHVLMRAAKDAARWQAELPRTERPLFVSVNVSTKQLFRADSVQEIRHILGRNIVPQGSLRLEITETLVMENPEQAAEVLEMLRAAGANLALDDFGTGYSALAYLQRFPFDTIKVDREIVGACSTPEGEAILRMIVSLAHELSKSVVAEGVENSEQANLLRTLGCEYGQGFHFGEPISDRAVINLLRVVRKSEAKKLKPGTFLRAKPRKADEKQKVRRKQAPRSEAERDAGPPSSDSDTPSTAVVASAGNGTQPTPPIASATSLTASAAGSLVEKLNGLRTRQKVRGLYAPTPTTPTTQTGPNGSRGGAERTVDGVPSGGAPLPPNGPVTAPPPLIIPLASETPLVRPPAGAPPPTPASPPSVATGFPPTGHGGQPSDASFVAAELARSAGGAPLPPAEPRPAAASGQTTSRARLLADRIARTLGGPATSGAAEPVPPVAPSRTGSPIGPPSGITGPAAHGVPPPTSGLVLGPNTGAQQPNINQPTQPAAQRSMTDRQGQAPAGAPTRNGAPPNGNLTRPASDGRGALRAPGAPGKVPDLSTLPPHIAKSLARLAGTTPAKSSDAGPSESAPPTANPAGPTSNSGPGADAQKKAAGGGSSA